MHKILLLLLLSSCTAYEGPMATSYGIELHNKQEAQKLYNSPAARAQREYEARQAAEQQRRDAYYAIPANRDRINKEQMMEAIRLRAYYDAHPDQDPDNTNITCTSQVAHRVECNNFNRTYQMEIYYEH
jgi:hypothetical protein